MSLAESVIQYAEARYPILYIESFEEAKVDRAVEAAARELEWNTGREWNAATGFCDFFTKSPAETDIALPVKLKSISDYTDGELQREFLVLKDAHLFFNDPVVIGSLKKLAIRITQHSLNYIIIIVSSVRRIPKELEKFMTILELDFPSVDEIRELIGKYPYLNLPRKSVDEMAVALKGLTEFEIENLLCSLDDSSTKSEYLRLILEQKQQMIMKSGILEMVAVTEKPEDIGGLENLKEWLNRKARIFADIERARAFGVSVPKGVLIAGMPGCGKSLTAKVTAQLFGVPLLRLDIGKIMGKYVGESEENMRTALRLAEAISPCVLWIDELEKAFAGIGASGDEVTVRLFGSFLTWMQEKQKKATSTFVIATANNISGLPSELLRKGRFDEIFYVDLPTEEERRKIFEIHIRKRRSGDLQEIDLAALAKLTEGFCGADIEGAVNDAIETAFVSGRPGIGTDDLRQSVKSTNALARIMEDTLKNSREFFTKHGFMPASKPGGAK